MSDTVVTLDGFMEDFTLAKQAEVAARTAELIDEELRLRDLRRSREQLPAG